MNWCVDVVVDDAVSYYFERLALGRIGDRTIAYPASASVQVIDLLTWQPAAHRRLDAILPALVVTGSIRVHIPLVVPLPVIAQLHLVSARRLVTFLRASRFFSQYNTL